MFTGVNDGQMEISVKYLVVILLRLFKTIALGSSVSQQEGATLGVE